LHISTVDICYKKDKILAQYLPAKKTTETTACKITRKAYRFPSVMRTWRLRHRQFPILISAFLYFGPPWRWALAAGPAAK
jgi:hypothetical protein